MATVITNQLQMQQVLGTDAQKALDLTMKELLDELQKFIQSDVYDKWSPDFYERTNDTMNNWEYTNPITIGNQVSSSLSMEQKGINYNGDKFQHGNPMRSLSLDDFLGILNGDYEIGNAFNFPQVDRPPFWDEFLLWANEHIGEIWIKNCKKIMG